MADKKLRWTNCGAPSEMAPPPMDFTVDSSHVGDDLNNVSASYEICCRAGGLSHPPESYPDPWDPNPDGDESYVWASLDSDYQFETTPWLDVQGD
jgi:hypothetical protein